MALSNGTYVILAATDTTKAVDVAGAVDDDYANVRIFDRNDSDAQIWHAMCTNSSTQEFQLICSLSGKSLDVWNGDAADGTNVQQYSDNDTRAQRWIIKPDGKSVTVGGVSYPTYTIVNTGANKAMDRYANGTASGVNIQIYTVNNTDAQRWVFAPKPTLSDGTYTLRSALNTNVCMDVAGGSTANGANVQLNAVNGNNSQVWTSKTNAQTGTCNLINFASGKYMDVANASTASGGNVQQTQANGNQAQNFLPVIVGSTNVNGTSVPLITLKTQVGLLLNLDAAGGQSTLGTNVQTWTDNGSNAQKWAAVPTEGTNNSMSVPSLGRVTDAEERLRNSYGWPWGNGTHTWYPVFSEGVIGEYQVRYRYRYRNQNSSFGAWSSWRSIRDNSSANSGWGEIRKPNFEFDTALGLRWGKQGMPITLDNNGNDCAEIEWQARSFSSVEPISHSQVYDWTNRILWRPSVTWGSVAYSPEGMWLPFTSDFHHGNNVMTISVYDKDGNCLINEWEEKGLWYNDTVKIPYSKIGHLPVDGETLRIDYTFTTCDGAILTASASVVVKFDTDHGITVSPTYTDVPSHAAVDVTFAKAATNECYIVVEKGHKAYMEPMPKLSETDSTVTFRCFPRIGQKWHVFCLAYQDDGHWGTHDDWRPTITIAPPAYVWNLADAATTTYSLVVGDGDAPSMGRTLNPDTSTHVTTGREHEVVTYGRTVASEFTVKGSLLNSLKTSTTNSTPYIFDNLGYENQRGHDVIFRSPFGDWAHVAILSVDTPQQGSYGAECSVSMREVTV